MKAMVRLLVMLYSGILLIACSHEVREASQKRFMQMVKEHEVKQITIINGHYVEVWLKPYATTSARYNNIFSNRKPDEPHFTVSIASEKVFRQELAKVNPKFSNISEERRGLFSH